MPEFKLPFPGEQSETENLSPELRELYVQAEAGDPDKQYLLGSRYLGGCGVEKDHEEAAKWFERAAEGGHARAQCLLGDAHGRIAPKDLVWAARW